ncbi:hypothetical protein Nepgr_004068 [Nepenthes gracilis]|uniref:Uncharacterized protein n=1 Tax=Nepenthes gracilis TaxID=150966 RepID=A0AAD3S0T3_NEPGR|nr:hypothetical protein Nepgr_004068 [Nepenthes gracilis]
MFPSRPPYVSNHRDRFGVMTRLQAYDYANLIYSEPASGLGSHPFAFSITPPFPNHMAEEESTTKNPTNESHKESQDHHDHQAWLRLGIGTHTSSSNPHHQSSTTEQQAFDPTFPGPAQQGSLAATRFMVELNLLAPGCSASSGGALQQPRQALPLASAITIHAPPLSDAIMTSGGVSSFGASLLYQQQEPGGLNFAASTSTSPPIIQGQSHRQQTNWGFPPTMVNPRMLIAASSSSSSFSPSSSSMPPAPFFKGRPFHQIHVGVHGAGPSSDIRVIEPPRRPHSGIWFMLLASQNQSKEPFLPQVAKSYIRIKDGRMTVRFLMKYLVNKLALDSESEVEIICRGQKLGAFLTLQHVRDNIWSPSDAVTFLAHPSSSATDHLMLLHYGRCM